MRLRIIVTNEDDTSITENPDINRKRHRYKENTIKWKKCERVLGQNDDDSHIKEKKIRWHNIIQYIII